MPLTPGTRLATYEILAPSARAGWARCTARATTGSNARSPSRCCPPSRCTTTRPAPGCCAKARLAATLNHPNICTVHEVGEADGRIYLAMELIDGLPLRAKIAERGTGLPTETVVGYGAQIAAALAHAHERHVIHRDLKSSNVVVTSDGRVKVLDFGLARRAWESPEEDGATLSMALTETGAVIGTPHYLAPEVLRGRMANERSDLWALGCCYTRWRAGLCRSKAPPASSWRRRSCTMCPRHCRIACRQGSAPSSGDASQRSRRDATSGRARCARRFETLRSGTQRPPPLSAMRASRVAADRNERAHRGRRDRWRSGMCVGSRRLLASSSSGR